MLRGRDKEREGERADRGRERDRESGEREGERWEATDSQKNVFLKTGKLRISDRL